MKNENINEAEIYLLSALLRENSRFEDVDLSPGHFGSEQHAEIFRICLVLIAESKPADVLTVADRLHSETGKEWLALVGTIARAGMSTENAKYYAAMVKSAAQDRQVRLVASEILFDMDAGAKAKDVSDKAVRALMSVNESQKNYDFSISEALTGAVNEIDLAHSAEGGIIGIKSGITSLDDKLGGFRNSDLIVIGARPAQGKTALLLNFANNAGVPCGIISMEQGNEQVGSRMISINGRISSQKIRLADFDESDWNSLTRTVSALQSKKIWIYDKSSATTTDIVRQVRKWKFKYGIKILFVDYLQRINGDRKLAKHEQVRDSTVAMKDLARDLEIPVVALAQVNREVEKRPNKRPGMADLSDSSSIEKEADQIITLYRDEVYNHDSPDKGIAELLICKNRHGPTGFIRALWLGEYMRFEDMSYESYGR